MISLRISDELKSEMDKLDWVNWSEILRSSLEQLVPKLETKDLAKAVILSDLLRASQNIESDSLKILKIWRK